MLINLTNYYLAVGNFIHPCKEEAIIKLSSAVQVPMFNAPIYLENKQQIGKVNEVFGPINQIVKIKIVHHKLKLVLIYF